VLTVRQAAGTASRSIGDVVSLRWQAEHSLLLDH
jgi:putative spermidine/putrescine transport system ATP-binding protein